MKRVPTIAPELHALLDEIVTDPRSALRLAPRRALLPWLASGDALSSRPPGATNAEKHLLAVYREELAQLLLDAAWIAYERAPVLAHAPRWADGTRVDMEAFRARWAREAGGFVARSRPSAVDGETRVLRACLAGPEHASAHALAQASLAVAPSDEALYGVALAHGWDEPRPAIEILDRLAIEAGSVRLRVYALNLLAARLLAIGCAHAALSQYRAAVDAQPESALARHYLFNLSVFCGDREQALEQSKLLDAQEIDQQQLAEAVQIIARWSRSLARNERARAGRIVRAIESRLSAPAQRLAHALVAQEADG